jgi:hypothetical protein
MARFTSLSRLATFEGDRTMHALNIVQQLLRSCCPHIHAARLTVILAVVAAAVRSRRLTLTELGRALISPAHVKHSIKRVDRLPRRVGKPGSDQRNALIPGRKRVK